MNRPGFFVSNGDLIILLLYGGALSYISTYVMPIDMNLQLIASGVLALVLGSLGPSFGELLEWVLFFCLGVFLAALIPEVQSAIETKAIHLPQIFYILKIKTPYCLKLLSAWVPTLPVGFVFYRITYRLSSSRYYRHARFF